MKKTVQIAFAIALVVIAIIGSIWQTELLGNIIYAVVIPSFILSIISFASEVTEKCEEDSKKLSEMAAECARLADKGADADLALYESGQYKVPYVEGQVPRAIYNQKKDAVKYAMDEVTYKKIEIFCVHCKKVCSYIMLCGYVLLFISLSLSPYLARWLSVIDLNCISLWSLALLYISLELKSEICALVFNTLKNRYIKKKTKELEDE